MTAYVFPGQGSQFKGMGADLFAAYPDLVERADNVLGYSIRELCLDDPEGLLNRTEYTQPALFIVNALSFQDKMSKQPCTIDYLAGHSLGEYNALYASGVIGFEQGIRLVKKRGQLMSRAAAGAMAAVLSYDAKKIADVLEKHSLNDIDIANYNEPSQTVISGVESQIYAAADIFENLGARYIPLNTSGAFHSRLMRNAEQEFLAFLNEFDAFGEFAIPVISNVTAQPYERNGVKEVLARQISSPVKWLQSIQYMLKQGETNIVELGESSVLSKMIIKIQREFAVTAQLQQNEAINDTPLTDTALPQNEQQSSVEQSVNRQANKTASAHIDEANSLVKQWNDSYTKGTRVQVKGFSGAHTVASSAQILFGHRAVIYLQGFKGYFDLKDLTVL